MSGELLCHIEGRSCRPCGWASKGAPLACADPSVLPLLRRKPCSLDGAAQGKHPNGSDADCRRGGRAACM